MKIRIVPKAIIIGAGSDSVVAARQFLRRGIHPLILEPYGPGEGYPERHPALHLPVAYGDFAVTAELYCHQLVRAIFYVRDEICSLHAIHRLTGELTLFSADYFYFPAPLHTLTTAMSHVPGYQFLPQRKFTNLIASFQSRQSSFHPS